MQGKSVVIVVQKGNKIEIHTLLFSKLLSKAIQTERHATVVVLEPDRS